MFEMKEKLIKDLAGLQYLKHHSFPEVATEFNLSLTITGTVCGICREIVFKTEAIQELG